MAHVLFDIVHPADVLFFLNPIRRFQAQGVEVTIASREKDVAIALLDEFGLEHHVISAAGRGMIQLAAELVARDWRLYRLVARSRPDVMAGFGGVAISHVGRLTGIPSLSFYDTDNAPVQQKLTLPLIDEWHVTKWYRGPEARGRTFRFDGLKELSYFHPSRFVPDRERAIKCGLDPDRDNFFLRLVEWRATHDVGHRGLSADVVAAMVERLEASGNVIISSESALPAEFARFAYRGDVRHVHDVMAYCRLYIGESATMGTESVVLGTPALVLTPIPLSYIEMLDATALLDWVAKPEITGIIEWIDRTLATPEGEIAQAWKGFIDSQCDVSEYVVEAIARHL